MGFNSRFEGLILIISSKTPTLVDKQCATQNAKFSLRQHKERASYEMFNYSSVEQTHPL